MSVQGSVVSWSQDEGLSGKGSVSYSLYHRDKMLYGNQLSRERTFSLCGRKAWWWGETPRMVAGVRDWNCPHGHIEQEAGVASRNIP